VNWKIYVQNNSLSASAFSGFSPPPGSIVQDDANASQFIADAKSGNLPAVTYIENPDADEHPGAQNIEAGVALSKAMVDAVMSGPLWKDSVFIITFDEGGGLFDHFAPPTNVVNPDGLQPIDICTNRNDSRCPTANLTHGAPPYDPMGDFTRYGYRVPLMVVSPYAKPGYVSHKVTDYTAWMRFVEKRFNLPNLTARDAAASDMTDFFDFQNPHWLTPPGNEPGIKNLSCHLTLP
jgi:phospholipase C